MEQTQQNMTKNSQTRIKKLSRGVAQVLVILISVLIIAINVVPRLFSLSAYCVSTSSMKPEINRGSLVLTEKIAAEDIQIGDILTFSSPATSEHFTHRVIGYYDDSKQQLITKGDANAQPDPMTTSYECVVGKVVRVIPNAGFPSIFVGSVVGKIIIITIYVFWLSAEIEAYASGKRRERTQ